MMKRSCEVLNRTLRIGLFVTSGDQRVKVLHIKILGGLQVSAYVISECGASKVPIFTNS